MPEQKANECRVINNEIWDLCNINAEAKDIWENRMLWLKTEVSDRTKCTQKLRECMKALYEPIWLQKGACQEKKFWHFASDQKQSHYVGITWLSPVFICLYKYLFLTLCYHIKFQSALVYFQFRKINWGAKMLHFSHIVMV